jgi:excinuclease ABC subunit A
VVVVEHDRDMMLKADYIVDMGPMPDVTAEKLWAPALPKCHFERRLTHLEILARRKKIEVPAKRREGNGKSLKLKGCTGNNLKNIDVEFPLGKLICVTGVSGSGKSTLINETLQPILSQFFTNR